jgi:hypothetical protein
MIYVTALVSEENKQVYERFLQKYSEKTGLSVKTSLKYLDLVVLKFLHELGHIVHKHPGSSDIKSINSTGRLNEYYEQKLMNISQEQRINDILNDKHELEAWEFAINCREQASRDFEMLKEAYRTTYLR